VKITIREANEGDYLVIGNLIKHELGYSDTDSYLLFDRLKKIKSDDNHTGNVVMYDLMK